MKIGIATFNRTHNYGSLLQSYALKTFLESHYGVTAEFINFSNDEQREMYAYLNKPNGIRNLVKDFLIIMNHKLTKTHFESFNDFQNKYLSVGRNDYRSSSEINLNDEGYQLLIAGSDQIWNVDARDFDEFYFLGFDSSIKKVAYAVSLGGTDFTKQPQAKKYINMMNHFDRVSVRERNSKKWLSPVAEKAITIMPDPTMLLSKENYIQEFDDDPIFTGDYIYYYGFKYDKKINEKVKELGKKLGMPVVVVDGRKYAIYILKQYGFKVAPYGGPKAFINLMKNAKVCVTQSFHGTVFSVLFQIPFFYMSVPNIKSDDDRASYLLEQLGLTRQLIPFTDIVSESENLNHVPFEQSVDKIDSLKAKAIKYFDITIFGE